MKEKTITDILKNSREHVVMRDYTTFRVGGVADYFIEVFTIDELVRVVRKSIESKIPYFILGGGSNVIFSDYGIPGIVIKNSTSNIAVMKEKSQIIADSGVTLSKLILAAISNELTGLEFLYGVPGTVGGALYGNAGAYGQSIGDYLKNITLLETGKDGIPKIVQYDASWMEIGYRETKLKRLKEKTKSVILSARFQFSQNQKTEILRKLNSFKEQRQKTQPIGLSAGCIFRNPIPSELKNITGSGTKGMPELPKERRAGYMLDKSGAKNLKVGAAEVSSQHANFIINKDGAKASEIRTLIEGMRDRVSQKFGITLEEEIEYVGQW